MTVPQHLLDQMSRLTVAARPAERVSLGAAEIDGTLSGGLKLGALHEVYAASGADAGAAAGFALGLVQRAARGRPILWARQDMLDVETGPIHAPGLLELGIAPDSVVMVRGRDADDVLKAGEDAARCKGLGAVLIEPWGASPAVNLTTSRRLGLAAAASGVTAIMLRIAAAPVPSAAETRWRVAAAPSHWLEAEAPGHPSFNVTLLRHRGGAAGETWCVEWRRDGYVFESRRAAETPLSRPVVPVLSGRTPETVLRRTG
ncbi:MAG: hypothetical protein QM698_08065 [Micropepsaceae bacterium]